MVLDLIQLLVLHTQTEKNVKNVIIFGADLSNSQHASNKKQPAIVLGHGLIQKINDTTIYAEKMYSLLITKYFV